MAANTNTQPAHTITRTIDVKRRTITTLIALTASEHLDRYGVTAWYGVEVITNFNTSGSWPIGKAYQTRHRSTEINADGKAHWFTLPLHGNELPIHGSPFDIKADRYSRAHLEEVADAAIAPLTTTPALIALEKWALRHAEHYAKYGNQHFTAYQLSQLA